MVDLVVVAGGDDRRNVVQRPETELDVAVAQFHFPKPRTTKGRRSGPSKRK